MFISRWGFLPDKDIELATVYGKPMKFPQIDNPTNEDILKHHKMYVDALKKLYDQYKDQYSMDPEKELEIF